MKTSKEKAKEIVTKVIESLDAEKGVVLFVAGSQLTCAIMREIGILNDLFKMEKRSYEIKISVYNKTRNSNGKEISGFEICFYGSCLNCLNRFNFDEENIKYND